MINKCANQCDSVVLWGVGQNHHSSDDDIGTLINYSSIKLIGIREYGIGSFPNALFVPCVSCMHPLFNKNYNVIEDIVVVEHKCYPINEFDYAKISNDSSMEKILEFIGQANVIITNSYHAAYWATLLEKKCCYTVRFQTNSNISNGL